MLKLLSKKGTIVIEVQYLLNTIQDLTFDNIYHEHYNYWSLTSLVFFFKNLDAMIFKVEKISTHGGSIRVYVKKGKKNKINSSVKQILEEEEKFGIKKYKTYSDFAERIFQLKKNVIRNIKKLKENNSKIIGYGAPAKATTALNFFNINKEIDFIVEDNKLKHGKYVPGVNIPIFSKDKIKEKNPIVIVLAWNFFEDIKKNNKEISNNFINIKSLEKNEVN